MLDERKKKVLRAIVEEYINTAEPVSSATISKKYGLEFSSATIRNDMAELENIGFLDKPHTSAGRVPSGKGYRFYVDKLLTEYDVSKEEIEYIKSKLETRVNEIEKLTKIATNTLSEMTHYTSVLISGTTEIQIIEDIKFVLLGNKTVMVIILTDAGIIKETIIKFDEDVKEEEIQTLSILFNTKLKGQPLETIDKNMEEYLLYQMENMVKIIKQIISELNKIIFENDEIYLKGANRICNLPEFKKPEMARNFLNLIYEKELMKDIVTAGGVAEDINIYIGEETDNPELKDFSIITFKHKVNNKPLGTIGIIGPKRMDYAKVISIMKYISKKINERKE